MSVDERFQAAIKHPNPKVYDRFTYCRDVIRSGLAWHPKSWRAYDRWLAKQEDKAA